MIRIMAGLLLITTIGCAQSDTITEPDPDGKDGRDTTDVQQELGWHEQPQEKRNQQIITEAKKDTGKQGGQCKTWIRNVIDRVSEGKVHLPSNDPQQFHRWRNSDAVRVHETPIEGAHPGTIVQMWLETDGYSGPHTAIILEASKNEITFIESNFGWDEKVGVRKTTPEKFTATIRAFTVYQVL